MLLAGGNGAAMGDMALSVWTGMIEGYTDCQALETSKICVDVDYRRGGQLKIGVLRASTVQREMLLVRFFGSILNMRLDGRLPSGMLRFHF